MTTKFTPGPWRAEYPDEISVRDDDGGRIAILANLKGRFGMKGRRDTSEVAANARLIAAAPDLLEALQNIAEYWNQDQNEAAMADACWHAIHTARAAIAKATGEQP